MTNEEEKTLIEEVLSEEQEPVFFEAIPDEKDSPLAQPVVEQAISEQAGGSGATPPTETPAAAQETDTEASRMEAPPDAPEQQIHPGAQARTEGFELPAGHAEAAAEALLGSANNVIAVGAGFFITIKKHEAFYEFDELLELIEEQNQKNIRRIKLDEEDQALLRPILIRILQKKGKGLSDEQQLLLAAISIIIKKAKVVIEVRAENQLLEQRFLDIIREQEEKQEPPTSQSEHSETEENTTEAPATDLENDPPDFFSEQLIEVAEEPLDTPSKEQP